MKQPTLTTTILLLSTLTAFSHAAVRPGSIKGVVLDRTTRAPIPDANIEVIGTQSGASSDPEGRFTIVGLKPGTYHIRASALGYIARTRAEVAVTPGRSAEVEFLLEPTVIKGREVEVSTGYFRYTPNLPTSTRGLSFEEIRRSPGAIEDVQRAIQALPGIASRNDQTNEIVVRGGSPYENLTVIEGIEIDNINHFGVEASSGGPISMLNEDFLREVTFSAGGFSARYGDRLSSVLDIELREGDRKQFRGEAIISMAGAGANLEGGFSGGRGSYLFGARKSYLDLIKGPIGLTAVPHFWDVQLKAVRDISPLNRLSLIGIHADDYIEIEAETPDAWSRGAEAVEFGCYRYALGARLRHMERSGFGELILARVESHYKADVFEMPGRHLEVLSRSTETTDQLHISWTGRAGSRDEWSVGASLKPISFKHSFWKEGDATPYDLDGDGQPDTTVITPDWVVEHSADLSLKYAGYIQYRWRPRSHLTLSGGLRLDGFDYSGYAALGPRLSARWEFLPRTTLSAAYGIYHQSHDLVEYTHDPDGGNLRLPHGRAEHYVAGISYLPRDATLLSLEAYYKRYRNLTVSEEELNDDPTFRSWRYLSVGRKKAWGVEAFAQQKLATNWYGTLSYSYGVARFTDYHRGEFPSDFDFRHIVTLVAGWNTSLIARPWFRTLQRNWYGWWTYLLPLNGDEATLASRFRYVSGRPYTPHEWTLSDWEKSDEPNSERYPDYSRLDVRWDSKWFFGDKALVIFLEVENLLDRPNVAEYIYADDGERLTVYQFRFFFVGGVRFEW